MEQQKQKDALEDLKKRFEDLKKGYSQ